MKSPLRRAKTPRVAVRCTRCGRAYVRYQYGFRPRIRWKKHDNRPTPTMSCTYCSGAVERVE